MNRDRIAELLGWERLRGEMFINGEARWRLKGSQGPMQAEHPVPETLDGLLALWPREKWLDIQIRGYEAGCSATCFSLVANDIRGAYCACCGETPYEAVAKLLLLLLEFKAANAAAPMMQA